MTQRSRQLLNLMGITTKMIGLALALGALILVLTETYESRTLSNTFEAHLTRMLEDQSQADRLTFNNKINAFHQVAELTAEQARFRDHIAQSDWAQSPSTPTIGHRFPAWFLSRTALRTLTAPRYAILLDADRQPREIFAQRGSALPQKILYPSALYIEKSHEQSHMSILDGMPYLSTAETIRIGEQEVTLLLASPIDDHFLQAMSTRSAQRIVALVSFNDGSILTSSNQQLLPIGSRVETLQKRYLISGREFHDYGGAELVIKLSSFLPRTELAEMKRSFVAQSQKQRMISAAAFIIFPILIMFWMARRIRRITRRVERFTIDTLGGETREPLAGDELNILEASFDALTEDVSSSHQIIRQETFKEAQYEAEIKQREKHLAQLQAVTDALSVGVLIHSSETAFPANKLMQIWVVRFGGVKAFFLDQTESEERVLTDPQGEEHIFLLLATQLGTGEQAILVRDITEQKAAEEEKTLLQDELSQAQKMESIGRLAGGVAHDFNNMLMAINGNAQLLKRRLGEDAAKLKYLEVILATANRAADLTKQLLGFSRKQLIDPRPLDLNLSITNMMQMLTRLIVADVEIEMSPGEGLWKIMADQTQIEQILMNLVINAQDAMPHGGKLLLESENLLVSEEYAVRHLDIQPGEYVLLSVSDTGEGIPAENLEHIFEPFFTTKPTGEGTGLGLATVYGIVKQNNGHIFVYSEPDKGTTFKIYLPRTLCAFSPTPTEESAPEVMPRGKETILLVEDEEEVRNFVVAVLSELGYTLIEAVDGEEAETLFNKYHGQIHLLLTDVVLPKMGGEQLAKNLRGQSAELKVLYMSGYTQNAIIQHGVLEEGINFLPKPVSATELASRVRSVLDVRTI